MPVHASDEIIRIKVVEPKDGIQITERVNHIIFLEEVLLPNEPVSFGLEKPR